MAHLTERVTIRAGSSPNREHSLEPEPVWLECVRRGKLPGGWAVDDGAGLVFEGGRLQEVVSARPGAGALRVDAVGGELVRSRIPGRLLDARGVNGDPNVSAKVTDAIRELRAVRELRGQQRRDQ